MLFFVGAVFTIKTLFAPNAICHPFGVLVQSPFLLSLLVSPLSLLRWFLCRRSGRLRCRLRLRLRRGLRRGLRRERGLQCGKIAQRDPERFGVVVGRHDVDALLFAAPSRRLACLNLPRPSSIVIPCLTQAAC